MRLPFADLSIKDSVASILQAAFENQLKGHCANENMWIEVHGCEFGRHTFVAATLATLERKVGCIPS